MKLAICTACLALLMGFTPLTGIELTKIGPTLPGETSIPHHGDGGGP